MAATKKASLMSRASAAARKAVGRKPSTEETAPAKKAAPAAKKSAPAKKAAPAAKKAAPAKKAASAVKKSAPAKLVVLEQEDPWSKQELAEVRSVLNDDITRLTAELHEVEDDLEEMIQSGADGAGNDQADIGSASFERDQEMVIVNNARDMLLQSQHALARILSGTYGICEECGNPIGKARLMAFPRATLCMPCKQREERR